MGYSKFRQAIISGICAVVPETEVCIYDEAEFYGNDTKKIDRMRQMVGFHKRRVATKGVTAADLAIQAAENLIYGMHLDRSTIDALVFVNQRPDFIQPATSFYIHHKLELDQQCSVFDVTHGCPGWTYGIWMASQMIESGACKRVLMLVGDTPSFGINPADRINAPVFGDGAAATLIEYSEPAMESWHFAETFSDGYEAITVPLVGARAAFNLSDSSDLKEFHDLLDLRIQTVFGHQTSLFAGYMDGMAVFNFTIMEIPRHIKKLLTFADRDEQFINYLFLHQANKQIIQAVGSASGFPEAKVPHDAFEHYGNNTIASIPTAICRKLSASTPDERTTILCSGFGNGLACCSCIVDLSKAIIFEVTDFKKPDNHVTRDQYIDYWKNKLKGSK
jgi:3-oxoacyl-[acyl-carrier-protein] synthase-3